MVCPNTCIRQIRSELFLSFWAYNSIKLTSWCLVCANYYDPSLLHFTLIVKNVGKIKIYLIHFFIKNFQHGLATPIIKLWVSFSSERTQNILLLTPPSITPSLTLKFKQTYPSYDQRSVVVVTVASVFTVLVAGVLVGVRWGGNIYRKNKKQTCHVVYDLFRKKRNGAEWQTDRDGHTGMEGQTDRDGQTDRRTDR